MRADDDMLIYDLPKEKKRKATKDQPTAIDNGDYARQVQIPVNTDMLAALSVGDSAMVMLHGEVISASRNDSQDYQSRSITLKVSQVKASCEGGGKGAKDFAKGFKKGKAAMAG